MPVPKKGDPNYVNYVIDTAKTGLIRAGVINEPRILFDEIAVPATRLVPANGDPGVFVNGEDFPLRLTHVLASMRFNASDLLAQQVGLRLNYHDQYYMNPRFLPLPVWGNKNVAAPQPVSSSTSHWDFVENGQPFVLSARDTLIVDTQLQEFDDEVDEPLIVTVTFAGVGAMSRRPYLLSGQRTLSNINPTDLPTVDFRNDGLEPIVITDMTINLVSESLLQTDVRNLRFNVKQVGNGTNASWFTGPQTPLLQQRLQATLAGVTTGRSIVHQLPGDGFIWEPGEGITAEIAAMVDGLDDVTVCIALAGYLMVL